MLGLTMGLLLISCSKSSSDESAASNSGVYKWQCKIDGVQYQYSTTTLGATATYSYGTLLLSSDSKPDGTFDEAIVIKLPSVSAGNFTINSGVTNTSTAPYVSYNHYTTIYTQQVYNLYNTMFGGTMNVNISSLSSNTVQTSLNNPGKVIGTFSGTLRNSPGNKTITITEGYFEALRMN